MSAKKKTRAPIDSSRNDVTRYLEYLETTKYMLSESFCPTDQVWANFAEWTDKGASAATNMIARAWLFENGHIVERPEYARAPLAIVGNTSQGLPPKVKHPHTLEDVVGASVEKEEFRYLWPGRLVAGGLNLLAGQMGHGKSSLLSEIAALVTQGNRWPDSAITDPPIENGSVLIIQAEESLASVQVPRLERHGADMERIRFIKWVNYAGTKARFNLGRDHGAFESYLEENEDIRLVMFDPIGAFLGGTDGNGEVAARTILDPYVRICEERDVCMLLVSHLNKDEDKDIINRLSGTGAFAAICRMVWYLSPDPFDKSRRLLSLVKGNGEECRRTAISFGLTKNRVLEWSRDEVDLEAQQVNDMLIEQRRLERSKGSERIAKAKENAARAFVLSALAEGPREQPDLFNEAKKNGIAASTFRDAIRFLTGPNDARVERKRPEGKKRWILSLATPDEPENLVELTTPAMPPEQSPESAALDRWNDDGGRNL